MKVSLSWLREYVDVTTEAEALAEALTMAGLEVDALSDRHAWMASVVVARIAAVEDHPNAERLRVCTVETGGDAVQVVCGAPNARAGLCAALALPGTELPDGRAIEAATIRGVGSHGMLCSEVELGLGEDAGGLLELSADLPLGRPLHQALGLDDPVFDIDLTPNRSDCLCVVGVAREVAAIQETALRPPEVPEAAPSDAVHRLASVEILDPDLCPRYAARLIEGVRVAPSPRWLRDRLLSIGQRPINNIVDITNFVMMELGQPLHAFDFDRLAGHRIVVRRARAGERFTTLDQKERQLDEDMLMICDGDKPVAVGGVMGGLNSEIEADTTRVLLESAFFSPVGIRRTAKVLGLPTEASHRFERGVDPGGTIVALNRAARLIAELGGGRLVGGVIDVHPAPAEPLSIPLSVAATNRLLGTELDAEAVAGLLAPIGFGVESGGTDPDRLAVRVPSYRMDVERPEDLMEEVARRWGYANIPVRRPQVRAELRAGNPLAGLRDEVRRWMCGFGFREAVTYSFIGVDNGDRLGLPDGDPRRRTVSILNPISEDQNVMRTTLVPGLLETAARNLAQQVRDLRLFEVGKVFFAERGDRQPDEVEMAAALMCGGAERAGWYGKSRPVDFYDVKGALEGVFAALKTPAAVFSAADGDARACFLRPGRGATVTISGHFAGIVGEVRPDVLERYGIGQPVFVFELDLACLSERLPSSIQVRPTPRYPATTRDITLIVDRGLEAADALRRIEAADAPFVESVQVFDVFEGDPIPRGRKSLSIRVVYRSGEGTLADAEVNRIHGDLTRGLLDALGAELP